MAAMHTSTCTQTGLKNGNFFSFFRKKSIGSIKNAFRECRFFFCSFLSTVRLGKRKEKDEHTGFSKKLPSLKNFCGGKRAKENTTIASERSKWNIFHPFLWLELFSTAVFIDLIVPKLHSWKLLYWFEKANRNNFNSQSLPLKCLLGNYFLEFSWLSVVMWQNVWCMWESRY